MLRLLSRITNSQQLPSCQFYKLSPVLFCSSRHEGSSDNGSEGTVKPKKNEEAIKKLNLLLKSMTEEEHVISSSGIGSQLARPPVKRKKEQIKIGDSLTVAAKEVAEVLGGDVKQTESELLNKLLSPSQAVNESESETQAPPMNLRDLISGMRIDRRKRSEHVSEEGRAKQVRRILDGRKVATVRERDLSVGEVVKGQQGPKIYTDKINIFGGEPLGIFKSPELQAGKVSDFPSEVTTWQRLEARELRLAVTHPPSNIFEEMIRWTEQGKLWHLPVNNEQGQVEESKVYFTEHVFLEHHLDPWCPQKGPVRHFMELVCVGLSKNPYITVQMKLEHITWFRDYFEKKRQILQDTGSIPAVSDKQAP
ncbi:28S ribosomal protein S31, mitochondrial [Zootermopsis nevadensis]|uniref:Small ribosomal subunit protein mS31 n=1 Tax=Zootermopsis nevadensis TaxID=136037 RepID=A0A067RLY8_ZOONE|nr:28S ribosomal protein S31, mitochondrial [Zootermopsis nevadensis]KDR20607.1 28S ribosomal protein S31, mitochondrial [Zootermopsis nevadensis]